jgi:hypothetical protein
MPFFRHLPTTSQADVTANFEQLEDSGWQLPTLENGWKQDTQVTHTVGYRRKANEVRLRGRLKEGENGKAAFRLPGGFQPPQRFYQAVLQGGLIMGSVVIEPNGEVVMGTAGEQRPSLDSITFTVD